MCLCVVCLVIILFSVLWVGLFFLACFDWFRFGMGRPSAKPIFFQSWPLIKLVLTIVITHFFANQTNS